MGDISYETDFLVIGGGAAGVIAALTAAEGGKKVIVLEKAGVLGGAGNAAQGLYAIDSPQQKAAGVKIDAEREFNDIMRCTAYLADASLVKAYLDNSGRMVSWLSEHGIEMRLTDEVQQLGHADSGLVYHWWNHLSKRFAHLREQMEKAGINIMTRVTAKELLQHENGTVYGAVAEDKDGIPFRIEAQSVLIATGGFVGNEEMVSEAMSDCMAFTPIHFMSTSQGEGLNMAWNAGAAKASEKAMVCHGVMTGDKFPPRFTHTDQALMNIPILWVNKRGERFINEEILFDSQFFGNACIAQGGIASAVFDSASLEEWKAKTIPYEMNLWDRLGENGTHFPAAVKDFDKEFAFLQEIGSGFTADTPEELADKIGWDRDSFLETLERYNRACDTGYDDLFYKSPRYLRYPIRKGPFYALQGKVVMMATVGGIRVDSHFRALTKSGKVIPGLYIAGADAGGIYHGHSYLPKEGFALGWALTTGMLAAEHILRNG